MKFLVEHVSNLNPCSMSSKARGPRRDDLTAPDGSLLTHCRQNCERGLTTIFGDVTVRRKGYRIAGVESLFPLDLDLNLAQDKYSHGLRRRVAEQVAGNSFDEAVANIEQATCGEVPKRQAEELSVAVAQDFETFYSHTERLRELSRHRISW